MFLYTQVWGPDIGLYCLYNVRDGGNKGTLTSDLIFIVYGCLLSLVLRTFYYIPWTWTLSSPVTQHSFWSSLGNFLLVWKVLCLLWNVTFSQKMHLTAKDWVWVPSVWLQWFYHIIFQLFICSPHWPKNSLRTYMLLRTYYCIPSMK